MEGRKEYPPPQKGTLIAPVGMAPRSLVTNMLRVDILSKWMGSL